MSPPRSAGILEPELADDQDIALSLQANEIARFEYDVVARHSLNPPALVGEVVIFGKKENAADATSGGLLDLVENRAAGNEVRLPVQNLRPEAEQKPLDRSSGCFRRAGITKEDITPFLQQRFPVVEGNAELVGVKATPD